MPAGGGAPLRIVVLTSHSAPGLASLLADPNRGAVYELAAVISSEEELEQAELCQQARIPLLLRPIQPLAEAQHQSVQSLAVRSAYDEELAEIVEELKADYLLLVGYNTILTAPFVARFEGRIIGLHDADLTLLNEDGTRRYAGLHAVREAIFEGEPETRSTAYFVDAEVCHGPIFLLSGPFTVAPLTDHARRSGDASMLAAYAELHRRWMVEAAWGEMLVRGLEFLAAGNLQVVHDLVWIDGAPGPCRMGDAPSICHKLEPVIDQRIPASCPLMKP